MAIQKEIPVSRPALQAIYARIGGEAKLRSILRQFYRKMADDLLIGFFFEGKNLDAIADMQAAFLMRAMGAKPSYSGKPPAQAHDELAPILAGHFDRRLRILEATLKENAVADEDIRTWIAFENAFREGIVREEGTPSPGTPSKKR